MSSFLPSPYSRSSTGEYGAVSAAVTQKSQNGWPASPVASAIDIVTYPLNIPSCSNKTLSLARSASGPLLEFIEWFNDEIEPITTAYGWNYREIRESAGTISNHGSGTAIDINAEKHPFKVRNTFTPTQAARILAKASSLGLVWGGVWGRPDDMHVELPKSTYGTILKTGSKIMQAWILSSLVGAGGLGLFLLYRWKKKKNEESL